MTIVFFSYSHRDEALRDELQTHLMPLQRDGLIESWHDRRIDAGDEVDGAIDRNLENANIVLLLVSPYFLASNYCYDVEMQRAMQRHEAGQACVIPVILNPCDWKSAPFGKLLAVPRDGRPITKFPNIHDGFLDVVQAIRKIVQPSGAVPAVPVRKPTGQTPNVAVRPEIRSSNLRVRKSFTDHDRDKFVEDAFEYIASFFEESLAELEKRNPEITTRFKRVDSNRLTAFIYRSGTCVSECGVCLGGILSQAITYCSDAKATNTMNDGLSVIDDGTTLFFKSMGMSSFGSANTQSLTMEGAAEVFWSNLMRPVQR